MCTCTHSEGGGGTGQMNSYRRGQQHGQRQCCARQFPVDTEIAYLGSSSRGRDDVACRGTATAPVLRGGAINGLLCGCGSMHRGHEARDDAKLIIEHLGDGRKCVGGAGCVGHNVHARVKALVVDPHDKHGSIIFRRRGHNHLDPGQHYRQSSTGAR